MVYRTKRILIATLENCDTCKLFKKRIVENNFSFDELVCSKSENGHECDNIEKICMCNTYPIAILDNSLILVLTTEYEKLGKVDSNLYYKIIYCHSINNMLDIIKKYLLLK